MDLSINARKETNEIVSFIKNILKKQKFENAVVGMSGGIDSTISFSLLRKSIPAQNIFIAHLYFFNSKIDNIKKLLDEANIPKANIYNISIKDSVDSLEKALNVDKKSKDYRIRRGNIMARVRMIALFDLAKKHNALVCGTENKSEMLLGYFTRFGDEAADFEPIQHLYKTQVYQLAKFLNIPQNIIKQRPTADLWLGQTDEGDFGFSYKEADIVLYLYFERHRSVSEIIAKGLPNAKAIIERVNKNSFKHHLPYTIK